MDKNNPKPITAHIVNIHDENDNTKVKSQICITGDLKTVNDKLDNWYKKDKSLPCYLTWYRRYNTCYLSDHIQLETEYGDTGFISIEQTPLVILGYCSTGLEHQIIYQQ